MTRIFLFCSFEKKYKLHINSILILILQPLSYEEYSTCLRNGVDHKIESQTEIKYLPNCSMIRASVYQNALFFYLTRSTRPA